MHQSHSQKQLRSRTVQFQERQKERFQSQGLITKRSNHQQQLEQLLTCHICYCLAKSMTMCPFCSKIYCQPCIKKSLFIKPQCPHCRKHIRDLRSMASCERFVNEIKGIVSQVLKQKQKQNFRCEEHDVALNYFCIECQRSVCCECKMFGKHKQHELVQIQKKYKQLYQETRQILAQIKREIRQKQILVQSLQRNTEQVKKFNQIQLSQISKLQKRYQTVFYQAFEKENKIVEDKVSQLQKDSEKLSQSIKQLKTYLNRNKKQHNYNLDRSKRQNYQKIIQSARQEIQMTEKYLNQENNLLLQVIPSYTDCIFVIENFSQKTKGQKQKQKTTIYSDTFQALNCQWKLKIYCNGKDQKGNQFLSVYIQMVSNRIKSQSNSQHSITHHKNPLSYYQYSIQIIKVSNQLNDNKQIPKNSFIREYVSSFEPGQSWGYNKYIQIKQIYQKNLIDKHTDRLTMKFCIRRPDYYIQYKSMELELQQIQRQIWDSQKIYHQFEKTQDYINLTEQATEQNEQKN